MSNKILRIKEGLKSAIPCMIGVVPFGLAYSILAVKNGLTLPQTVFMSLIVFAGSAQFMAVEMIGNHISSAMIIISTILINLRHLLMGISLTQHLKNVKSKHLALISFGMADETYAVSINEFNENKDKPNKHYFYIGVALGMYVVWALSTVVGSILGQYINDPLAWGLDYAMPATFACIIIPQIKNFEYIMVVIVSAVVTVLGYMYLPGKWYIIVATLVATGAGVLIDNLKRNSKKEGKAC